MAFLYAVQHLRTERKYKPRVMLDNMTEEECVQVTRMPKIAVTELLLSMEQNLKRKTDRAHALSPEIQLLTALEFYSSGSFQWMTGNGTGISQSSASRSIEAVTNELCSQAPNYISFQRDVNTIRQSKLAFNEIAGFPNVIGCIDGTHVRILAPHESEEAFVNRKGYHSINVQAVCDSDMQFIDVVARWPGSSHDSFIWRNSFPSLDCVGCSNWDMSTKDGC